MFSSIGDRITPAQIILAGFLSLITLGTLLLMLPISTQAGVVTPFLDALFTATSATCVTGLVVYDTALHWSMFGQLVLLVLIQIGGMGVITMGLAVSMVVGQRIGFKERWVMQESISAPHMAGIVRFTSMIFKGSLLIEGLGALLLAFRFVPQFGLGQGIWYSIFHSISAFCNAGFDLMGVNAPFSSMVDYTGDVLVNLVLIALIVLGGLGFLTWQDILTNKLRWQEYRLQSKLILTTTAALLLTGMLFFYFYELQLPQWAHLTQGERTLSAMFQAVTPRTAGFNTIDLTQMSQPGQAVMLMHMLVGGAPGSTAGGFKITTLTVLLLITVAVFRRKTHPQCFGRRLEDNILRNAIAIFLMYLLLFALGGIAISCIEGLPLSLTLFESASAVATVGLSLGLTPTLSEASQVILIFLMYLGRVGGLTLIYAVTAGTPTVPAKLPQEWVTVG